MLLFHGRKSNQKFLWPRAGFRCFSPCVCREPKLRWCAIKESNVGLASNEGEVPKTAQAVRTKPLDCSQHPFLSGAALSVRRENYICEAQKTPTFFRTRALIFCCYSLGASSSALAAAFGASASAAGASVFASASAM